MNASVIHVMYVGLTIEAAATFATPAGRSAGTPAAAIRLASLDAVRRKVRARRDHPASPQWHGLAVWQAQVEVIPPSTASVTPVT